MPRLKHTTAIIQHFYTICIRIPPFHILYLIHPVLPSVSQLCTAGAALNLPSFFFNLTAASLNLVLFATSYNINLFSISLVRVVDWNAMEVGGGR